MSVLVIDDEDSIRKLLGTILEEDGFVVTLVGDVAGAAAQLEGRSFDIIIVDKNLPDGSGLDVARSVADRGLGSKMIMFTGYGDFQSAVDAMRLGVADYLEKPLKDVETFRDSIKRVKKLHGLEQENRQLVAELSHQNERLEGLAVRDPQTGLYNHAFFQRGLELEIQRSERLDLECGLLLLDVDNFKQINDALGHTIGDQVLHAISDILKGQGKLSFQPRDLDISARFGSDEFAVTLPETSKRNAIARAELLRASVEQFDFRSLDLPTPTLSIGIAAYPEDGKTRHALIDAADLALYTAKRSGPGRLVAYLHSLPGRYSRSRRASVHEVRVMEALESSIVRCDFDYVYQPIVHAATGATFAFEALVRPRHSAFPNPPALIEAAERAGQIRELGRALREVSIPAIESLPDDTVLFVNLHPDEVYDPELLEPKPFLAPWTERIVFEITEVADIKDYERLRSVLDKLRRIGYRVALDDLGSGYSGLNSLTMLEPDFVKLDMDLVRAIHRDKRAARLAQHILEFAEGEGMRVVAEGIETEDEAKYLTDMGCPLLQGYYFSKPRRLDDILDE